MLRHCIFTLSLCFASAILSACEVKETSAPITFVETRDVADDDSLLLQALIRPSDFGGDWQWFRSAVNQKFLTPASENNSLVESAHQRLAGFYGAGNEYIDIFHSFRRYELPVVAQDFVIEMDGNKLSGSSKADISFESAPPNTLSECYQDSETLICRIITIYGDVVSTIVVGMSSNLDPKVMQDIVNQAMNVIDMRVKQIATGNK